MDELLIRIQDLCVAFEHAAAAAPPGDDTPEAEQTFHACAARLRTTAAINPGLRQLLMAALSKE